MNTSDTQITDHTSRPFGYWLKAVDRLMAAEFASSFEGEHASRRDWRLLNVVDGTAPARRPLTSRKLHGLIERGWVVADGDGWALTDDGRAAKDRLGAVVDGIRARVTDAVSPEDLATTLASLEQIARAFGWDEETPLPRGRGHRHGFGPRGFGHGFGPDRGFGPGHEFGHGFGPGRSFGRRHGHPFGRGRGFAPGPDSERGSDAEFGAGHCGHRHGEHRHGERPHGEHRENHTHGHPRHGGEHRAARATQHAYERGFDAGFSRGRDA